MNRALSCCRSKIFETSILAGHAGALSGLENGFGPAYTLAMKWGVSTQPLFNIQSKAGRILLFFFVAPVAVSCVETFLQHSTMADGSLLVSLGFALLFTVPGTFFAWLMTWLIARLPAANRLPLPLLLLLGFAVSLLVFRPYNRFIYELIQVTSPQIARMSGDESLREVAEHFLLINVPGALIWTFLNLLFIAKTGFPVYGASRKAEIEDDHIGIAADVVLPDFCRTASLVSLRDLWAISAEEHYLRLHGPFGTRMIRHPFGAALEQMPFGQGLQVHRSHWVAFGCVVAIECGGAMQLHLADGTHIPVSSSYRRAVLLKEAELLGT